MNDSTAHGLSKVERLAAMPGRGAATIFTVVIYNLKFL
jgi:hypothetical protein